MKKIILIFILSTTMYASVLSMIPAIYQGYKFVGNYISKYNYIQKKQDIKTIIENQETDRAMKDFYEISSKRYKDIIIILDIICHKRKLCMFYCLTFKSSSRII